MQLQRWVTNKTKEYHLNAEIFQVGPTCSRKTLTGLLASEGLRVSKCRVGESLRTVNSTYQHARRTATARGMNPI